MNKILFHLHFAFFLLIVLVLGGLFSPASGQEPKEAEPAIKAAKAAVLKTLPFGGRQDYEDARYGFIGTMPEVLIKGDSGMVIWNPKEYDFLKQPETPGTVNLSLWRQAQPTCHNGLSKITGSMYQVRGSLATSSR